MNLIKPFEPRALGNDWFAIHPSGHESEIFRSDSPFLNAQQDVVEQRLG